MRTLTRLLFVCILIVSFLAACSLIEPITPTVSPLPTPETQVVGESYPEEALDAVITDDDGGGIDEATWAIIDNTTALAIVLVCSWLLKPFLQMLADQYWGFMRSDDEKIMLLREALRYGVKEAERLGLLEQVKKKGEEKYEEAIVFAEAYLDEMGVRIDVRSKVNIIRATIEEAVEEFFKTPPDNES